MAAMSCFSYIILFLSPLLLYISPCVKRRHRFGSCNIIKIRMGSARGSKKERAKGRRKKKNRGVADKRHPRDPNKLRAPWCRRAKLKKKNLNLLEEEDWENKPFSVLTCIFNGFLTAQIFWFPRSHRRQRKIK